MKININIPNYVPTTNKGNPIFQNLKIGNIVQALVLEVYDNEAILRMSDGNIIKAEKRAAISKNDFEIIIGDTAHGEIAAKIIGEIAVGEMLELEIAKKNAKFLVLQKKNITANSNTNSNINLNTKLNVDLNNDDLGFVSKYNLNTNGKILTTNTDSNTDSNTNTNNVSNINLINDKNDSKYSIKTNSSLKDTAINTTKEVDKILNLLKFFEESRTADLIRLTRNTNVLNKISNTELESNVKNPVSIHPKKDEKTKLFKKTDGEKKLEHQEEIKNINHKDSLLDKINDASRKYLSSKETLIKNKALILNSTTADNSFDNNILYFHIPLYLKSYSTIAKLYFLRNNFHGNKKAKKNHEKNLSLTACIILELKNIGSIQTMIHLIEKTVSIIFKVEEQPIANFINNNYLDIYHSLKNRGYNLSYINCKTENLDIEPSKFEETISKEMYNISTKIDFKI